MNEARPLKTVGLVGMAGTLGLQRSIHLSDVMGYGEGEETAEGGGGEGRRREGRSWRRRRRERMRTDWLCGSIKSFS